jgi:hypothetical protein
VTTSLTRQDHLLIILGEECAEVQQRIAKIQRFGLDEVQPGQPLTNRERLKLEVYDVLAMVEMLSADKMLEWPGREMRDALDAKKAKVEHFLDYSEAECGTVHV